MSHGYVTCDKIKIVRGGMVLIFSNEHFDCNNDLIRFRRLQFFFSLEKSSRRNHVV